MKKMMTCWAALALGASAFAVNTTQQVAQVNNGVKLTTAVDYFVSNANPFGTAGSIDIQNPQAVLFFPSVLPSVMKQNYLANVYVNGEKAVDGTNVRVTLYNQGCIVLPYAKGGLTLFADADAQGTSVTYEAPSRADLDATHNNHAESFTLKRGYYACLYLGAGGTGYNRVWVADKEDITVNLPAEMKNKVSSVRVFEWKWGSKKGYAGTDQTYNARLNTTWFYGWNASDYSRDDREYIPHHHHEGWPSYSQVIGHNDCTAILGNNEPDNTAGGEQFLEYTKALNTWPEMMKGGQRLVSPAVASNLSGWLYPFMDSIDARGWRCDAVAVHAYWNSNPTSFMNSLKAIYNRTKRPLWITEFNYGANWTKEVWPDADRTATPANCERMRAWMAELIPLLDAAPYVERYAIYNWVQGCRSVYLNGNEDFADNEYLTPAGLAYADVSTSTVSYQPENIAPIVPKYRHLAPSVKSAVYKLATQQVQLELKNNDGEQTESIVLERNADGGDFTVLKTLTGSEAQQATFEYVDDMSSLPSALYGYRLRAVATDGKERVSGLKTVALMCVQGNADVRTMTATVPNTDEMQVSFNAFEGNDKPAVIMGVPTQNNANFTPIVHINSLQKTNFTFSFMPWEGLDAIVKNETLPLMVARKGNYSFHGKQVEIATAKDAATGNDLKVKKAEVEVLFNVPFPEGVTPVVIPQEYSVLTSGPFIPKVTDVTNKGFKLHMACSEACTSDASLHYVNYIAVEPGQTVFDNGMTLSAGIIEGVGSALGKKLAIADAEGKPYVLADTLLFAATQTDHSKIANLLRYKNQSSGIRLYRLQDPATTSANVGAAYYDNVGWMTVSSSAEVVGIQSAHSHAPLTVKVVNGRVVVNKYAPYTLYQMNGQQMPNDIQLPKGTYLVKCGNETVKINVE